MASKWFYMLNGEKHGPVSSLEIRKLVRIGTISPHDLLWKQGMRAWLPAGKSASLFPPTQKTIDEPLASPSPPLENGSGKMPPPAEDESLPAGLPINDSNSGSYDAPSINRLDSLRIWGTEWTQALRSLKRQHAVLGVLGLLGVGSIIFMATANPERAVLAQKRGTPTARFVEATETKPHQQSHSAKQQFIHKLALAGAPTMAAEILELWWQRKRGFTGRHRTSDPYWISPPLTSEIERDAYAILTEEYTDRFAAYGDSDKILPNELDEIISKAVLIGTLKLAKRYRVGIAGLKLE